MEFTLSLIEPSQISKEDFSFIALPFFPFESHSKDVFFTMEPSKGLIDCIEKILHSVPETFIQYDFVNFRWNLMHFNETNHCHMVINIYNISVSHNAIEFLFKGGDFEFYKKIMCQLFFLHDGSFTCECNIHNHKEMFELPEIPPHRTILKDALTDVSINTTMLKKTLSATLKNGHPRGVLEATQVLCTIYKEEEALYLKEEDLLCLREMINLILRDKGDCGVQHLYALSVLERLSREKGFALEITKNINFVNAIFHWRRSPVETFIGSIAVQKATIIFDNLQEMIDTDCLLDDL
jgi:hypothetical protein